MKGYVTFGRNAVDVSPHPARDLRGKRFDQQGNIFRAQRRQIGKTFRR
jgi:hypothetical protein